MNVRHASRWAEILEPLPNDFEGVTCADSENGIADIESGKALRPSKEDLEAGYRMERGAQADLILRSGEVDRWLCSRPHSALSVDPDFEDARLEWILGHECRPINYLRFKLAMLQERLVNEEKIALVDTLRPGGGETTIGKTSYFATVVTNEACTKRLTKAGQSWRDFRSLFPVDTASGVFLGLRETNLSNQIGASTLAFTKDRRFVAWKQVKGSQRSLGRRVPTGSGSIIWADHSSDIRNDLLSVVRFGMARELGEEAGLGSAGDHAQLADATFVIGHFRWIEMGGLPEFIGLTRLSEVNSNELVPEPEEVSHAVNPASPPSPPIHTLEDAVAFCAQMRELPDLSTPLFAIVDRLHAILTDSRETVACSEVMEFLGIAR